MTSFGIQALYEALDLMCEPRDSVSQEEERGEGETVHEAVVQLGQGESSECNATCGGGVCYGGDGLPA